MLGDTISDVRVCEAHAKTRPGGYPINTLSEITGETKFACIMATKRARANGLIAEGQLTAAGWDLIGKNTNDSAVDTEARP